MSSSLSRKRPTKQPAQVFAKTLYPAEAMASDVAGVRLRVPRQGWFPRIGAQSVKGKPESNTEQVPLKGTGQPAGANVEHL